MNNKEAFEIVKQICRSAPVNAEVGERRDEALAILLELVEEEE